MSNRRKRPGKKAARCPKCHKKSFSVKEYSDAFIRICNFCSFPVREEKI